VSVNALHREIPRKSMEANLGRIKACAEAYYDIIPTQEAVWKSTRHKDLTRKTRVFLWRSTHDAFKIEKSWKNIENPEHRGLCSHGGTEGPTGHILTEFTAPGREQVWSLANELWLRKSPNPIPTNYSALLGCGLASFKKTNDTPEPGRSRPSG
jgi:hypothetical protein